MRRKVLLVSVLLLALVLLSTTPVVAKRPPPKGETKTVHFVGDITGTEKLVIDERGTNLWMYGMIDLTFSSDFGEFAGPQYGGLRITLEGKKNLSVNMYYSFDLVTWYFPEGDCSKENIPKYYFEGSGFFNSYGVGVYKVTLDDAAVYKVVPSTNKKCQGYGLEFVEPDSVSPIEFTLEIAGE